MLFVFYCAHVVVFINEVSKICFNYYPLFQFYCLKLNNKRKLKLLKQELLATTLHLKGTQTWSKTLLLARRSLETQFFNQNNCIRVPKLYVPYMITQNHSETILNSTLKACIALLWHWRTPGHGTPYYHQQTIKQHPENQYRLQPLIHGLCNANGIFSGNKPSYKPYAHNVLSSAWGLAIQALRALFKTL